MMRWAGRVLLVVGVVAGLLVACTTPQPYADDNGAEGVRTQVVPNPINPHHSSCVLFTHDTSQGASIAVWCGNS